MSEEIKPTTMPKKRRLWLWILLGLLVAIAGGAFWLKSRLTPERVAADVKRYIEARYGAKAEIAAVELRWPPAVLLKDVKIFRPDLPESVIRFRELSLAAALGPLFSGRVEVEDVSLSGADLAFSRDADGHLKLPIDLVATGGTTEGTAPTPTPAPAAAGAEKRGTAFLVRRVKLDGINLKFQDEGNKALNVRIEGLAGRIRPDLVAGWVNLELQGREARSGAFRLEAQLDYRKLRGKGSLSCEKLHTAGLPLPLPDNALPQPTRLELVLDWTRDLPQGKLSCQGIYGAQLMLQARAAEDTDHVRLNVDLAGLELETLFMALKATPGVPDLPVKQVAGKADLNAVLTLDKDFTARPETAQLRLPDLAVTPDKGETQQLKELQVVLKPEGERHIQIEATVKQVDLAGAWVLARPWLPKEAVAVLKEVSGQAKLAVHARLKDWKPAAWSADFDLKALRLIPVDYPVLQLDGGIHVEPGPLKLTGLKLSAAGLRAVLAGSVEPRTGNLDLEVKELNFQPAEMKGKAKLPMDLPAAGRLEASLRVKGRWVSPKLSGQLKAIDLAWTSGPWKDMTWNGNLSLQDGTLRCPALVLTGPLGRFDFAGRVTDVFGKRELDSRLKARELPVPALVGLAGMAGLKSTGQLALDLELKGPLSALSGAGQGKGEGVQLEFNSLETGKPFLVLPFQAITLGVKLDRGKVSLELPASLFDGTLQLQGQLDTTTPGFPATLSVETPEKLDLQAFLALNPYARKALIGRAAATARLSGLAANADSFTGQGQIRMDDLVLDGEKLFGKLAPYVPNLAQERFDRSELAFTLKGRQLTLHDLKIQNRDMAVGGRFVADLDTFAMKGQALLTIFKPAVKQGSDLERAIPDTGLKIDIPVKGNLFAPELELKLDVRALTRRALESHLLDAVLKRETPTADAPGSPPSGGGDTGEVRVEETPKSLEDAVRQSVEDKLKNKLQNLLRKKK